MDADQRVNRLVQTLLSAAGAERARALEQEDPSSFSEGQWRAFRDVLGEARSLGQLSNSDHSAVLFELERWYATGDGSNTDDLMAPEIVDRDPTVDIVASTTRVTEHAKEAESAAQPESRAQFVVGATIRERYLLEKKIGAGGTAIVFRALDLRRDPADTDAHVALKVARVELRKREDIAERLRSEFQQSQKLVHPGIVRTLEIDREQGTWFLTRELLEGETLSSLLARHQNNLLPEHSALQIIEACGEALAFAHQQGVLHCDFKPGNVFVTANKEIRVLDFGIASRATDKHTANSPSPAPPVKAATRCYASPEVLRGEPPGESDDVFSLACVCYEVLTGRHPFGRLSIADACARDMKVARARGLSDRRFTALKRALRWARRDRTSSVRELLVDLGISEGKRKASPAVIGALTAAVFVLALITTFVLRANRNSPELPGESPLVARQQSVVPEGIVAASESGVAQPRAVPTQSTREVRAAVAVRRPPANAVPASATASASTAILAPAVPSVPRARVSLEQPHIVVYEGAASAVLRVRRADDLRGPVRLQWRANSGSAASGSDYEADSINVVDFPEGHDLRVIYVPIVHDTLAEGDESFEIELVATAGRARIGPVARATVTIFDDD